MPLGVENLLDENCSIFPIGGSMQRNAVTVDANQILILKSSILAILLSLLSDI